MTNAFNIVQKQIKIYKLFALRGIRLIVCGISMRWNGVRKREKELV